MRFDSKMPAPATAPAAGSTTTFKLPIGRQFHSLSLLGFATAFTVAELEEIRLLANENVVQRFTGEDRNIMNLFDGRESAAISAGRFELVIPFDRYGLLDRIAEEETAINTGSIDPQTGRQISSLSLEVDLKATGITGTPRLELNATQSEQRPGGPGLVPYIYKSTRDFAAADTYDISDLPRGQVNTQFLDKLFIKPSTGTLDTFQFLANDVKIFERTAERNERAQRDGVRVPQNGWYAFDRTEHGYGGDPFDLRGLQDFRLKLATSGAMSTRIYAHYIGGLAE